VLASVIVYLVSLLAQVYPRVKIYICLKLSILKLKSKKGCCTLKSHFSSSPCDRLRRMSKIVYNSIFLSETWAKWSKTWM